MRKFRFPPALLFLFACSAPAPRYAQNDPLSGNPPPAPFVQNGTQLFQAVLPIGYESALPQISPPLIAHLRRPVYGGEALLSVERYDSASETELDQKAFERALGTPRGGIREFSPGKKEFHDLRFESTGRRISTEDPSSDSLGRDIPLPRIDPLGKRRFPRGGEAYKLYRCRKRGAWRILDEQKSLRIGLARGSETPPAMKQNERKILSACFGRLTVERLERGVNPGSIPKPSMSRLRLMAADEWEHGSAMTVERECVHILPLRSGFAAVRFKTTANAFEDEHSAFERFAGSLVFAD